MFCCYIYITRPTYTTWQGLLTFTVGCLVWFAFDLFRITCKRMYNKEVENEKYKAALKGLTAYVWKKSGAKYAAAQQLIYVGTYICRYIRFFCQLYACARTYLQHFVARQSYNKFNPAKRLSCMLLYYFFLVYAPLFSTISALFYLRPSD